MPEFVRSRDCVVFFKGDAYPVSVAPELLATGWRGGQGVMWADSVRDEFTVKASDGLCGGFLLWGSDEESDQWTGITDSPNRYGVATFCAGGWMMSTSTFERWTWSSRQANALDPTQPLVPIPYRVGERLVFSLRGLFTNEDEWTLSGDARAPNRWFVAQVIQAPAAYNGWTLTLQTAI